MISLLLALAVLPASAAPKKHKAAEKSAQGVYQGKTYHFTLPSAGGAPYKTELESGDAGEQLYIYPPGLSGKKLADLSPGQLGKSGIVKIEVVRPEEGDKTPLKALEQQTVEEFEASGAKVSTDELTVLKLPGFYARVEGKEHFALFVMKGKGQLYYVTAGLDDTNAIEVVSSFGEGKAPPPSAPPKTSAPADPFEGRKLHVTDTRSKGQIDADKYREQKEEERRKKQR